MANLKIADFINLDFVLFYAFIGISHKFIHSRKKKTTTYTKQRQKRSGNPPSPRVMGDNLGEGRSTGDQHRLIVSHSTARIAARVFIDMLRVYLTLNS